MNKQAYQPEDKWLEAVRHKLDEGQVPPPADGWARLESALDASKRGVVLWPWLIPAAVAAMAIFVFLWDGGVSHEEIPLTVESGQLLPLDSAAVHTVTIVPTSSFAVNIQSLAHKSTSTTSTSRRLAYTKPLIKKGLQPKPVQPDGVISAYKTTRQEDTKQEEQETSEETSLQSQQAATHVRAKKRQTNIPWGDPLVKKKRKRRYRLSLLASSGVMNSQKVEMGPDVLTCSALDIGENEGKIYKVSENLLYRAQPEYTYDHDLPVKVGVGVTVSFAERWAIETGLMYTRLRSQLTDVRDAEKITQAIHYLGVPLRLNYTWLLRTHYTCYTAFGGTIERAVDARLDGSHLDVHGIQCGLEGAVGVQYKLSKQWGLFGEIGVSHYFDDDSQVETYRDEHRTSLLLNFGLRFDF